MIVGTDLKTPEITISIDNRDNLVEGRLITEAHSDPAAFARLYRRHYDAVFRYCVHRLFDRHAAEDVTATVFLKVVENIGRFRGTERQFRNWLYRIATNAVNNHLRKNLRRDRLLIHVSEQTQQVAEVKSADDITSDKLAILREAMLTLKPKYQTIITLRFFENLKLTEIAEVLGSRAGTVRSQLARALAKLRERIRASDREVWDND